MDVVETRYAVPGWGAGELWQSGAVVVAHDFRFGALANGGAAAALDGLASRFEAFLAGEDVTSTTSSSTSGGRRRSSVTSPTRYGPCPAARW